MTKFRSNHFLYKSIGFIFIIFTLVGCSTTSDISKHIVAENIAATAGFEKKLVQGGKFLFTTFQKNISHHKPYIIYIEGDGQIAKGSVISLDPTPKTPMLITLITLDKRENLVYLARPCQHTPMELNPNCNKEYWLDKRMSEDSVESMNEAIKHIAANNPIDLVGFSGGGGMAILIAAQNHNVRSITTIAGNLDTLAFTEFHRVRPIKYSLNPIDYAKQVNNIPQLHLSGGNDRVVPALIADNFVKVSDNPKCIQHRIFPNNTHTRGWNNVWGEILEIPVKCNQ